MNLHRERAFAAIEMGRWELAVKAIAAGLLETPHSPDLHAAAAVAYCELELFESALQSAEKVIELEPTSERGFRLLMEANRRLGNRAVEFDPKLARRYFLSAIEAGKEGLRLNPHATIILANLSVIVQAIGDSQQAHALSQRALETNPESLAALHACGLTQAHRGDQAAAETSLRRALSLAPEEPTLHLHLAKTLLAKHDFRTAFKEAQTALQLDPSSPEAQQHYRRVLQTQSALVRALLRVSSRLRRSPTLRCSLLAISTAVAIVGVFASSGFASPILQALLAAAIGLGFVAFITVTTAPDLFSDIIWFFAKSSSHTTHLHDLSGDSDPGTDEG